MTLKRKAILSDISLFFVAFVWGGGFVAVKDALNTITPMYIMAFRFALAALFLMIFFLITSNNPGILVLVSLSTRYSTPPARSAENIS